MAVSEHNDVNNRLEQIESNQEAQGRILDEIKTALLGNDYNKRRGYLDMVDGIEERVKALEKNQAAQKWFLYGAGITSGAAIVKVLESIF